MSSRVKKIIEGSDMGKHNHNEIDKTVDTPVVETTNNETVPSRRGRPQSEVLRKAYTTKLDIALIKKLKIHSATTDQPANAILEKLLTDYFKTI